MIVLQSHFEAWEPGFSIFKICTRGYLALTGKKFGLGNFNIVMEEIKPDTNIK